MNGNNKKIVLLLLTVSRQAGRQQQQQQQAAFATAATQRSAGARSLLVDQRCAPRDSTSNTQTNRNLLADLTGRQLSSRSAICTHYAAAARSVTTPVRIHRSVWRPVPASELLKRYYYCNYELLSLWPSVLAQTDRQTGEFFWCFFSIIVVATVVS